MVKHIQNTTYACSFCGKRFNNIAMVDSCEKSHHLVFIPMPKEWLFRLIQFIYTKEEKLLPEGLVKLLTHYARAKEYTTTDLPNLQETD